MTKGCIASDLEHLENAYRTKILNIKTKLSGNEYSKMTKKKMMVALATYKASLDELMLIRSIPRQTQSYGDHLKSIRHYY